jgi:diacylglycerol kinase
VGEAGRDPAGLGEGIRGTLHGLKTSFRHAWDGLLHVYKTQRNMRLHMLFATLVGAACLVLGVGRVEVLMVSLAVAAVLASEVVNTVAESLTDLMESRYSELAKVTKDVAAAGVLLTSMFALLIGVIAFYPALLDLPARLSSFIDRRVGYFTVYSVLIVVPALAGLAHPSAVDRGRARKWGMEGRSRPHDAGGDCPRENRDDTGRSLPPESRSGPDTDRLPKD